MFIDKQKLERGYLEELTKIGNLFDTIDINHCVVGGYALLAHGFKTKSLDCAILSLKDHKEKIIEVLFKLNYTIYYLSDNLIKAKKSHIGGDLIITIYLGKSADKKYTFEIDNREVNFPKKIFKTDRVEVLSYLKGKKGRGYFRAAPLEELYFLKMNSENENDIFDLELIKASRKLDVDRLISIFKLNNLI